MKTIASVAIAGVLAATTFAATTTGASADRYWKRHHHHHHYHSRGIGPGAAIATGALLGLTIGTLATPRYAPPPPVYYDPPPAPPRGYRYSAQHVSWCSDRYRSYDAYDNSWVDYDGFAHQCVSPY